jgi:hypothetical protein
VRRNLVKALVVLLFFSTALKASAQEIQSQYITGLTPLLIPSGKVCEVLSVFGLVTWDNGIAGSTLVPANVPYLIPGGGSLMSNISGAVIYRLKDNISTITIPTSAVVIPTDATGPVDIILESSTDLVTWTQANPGTYGASTSKRFFRVRAVNQ